MVVGVVPPHPCPDLHPDTDIPVHPVVIGAQHALADRRRAVMDRTTSRRAVLVHVAVDDAERGQGIGRALCQEFVHRARAAGCDDIRLSTVADGPAADFYDRLGWQRMGSTGHPDGVELVCYRYPVAAPRNG